MGTFKQFLDMLTEISIAEGHLVKEDDVILLPCTVDLIKEIEAAHLQLAIDKALDQHDEVSFRKLVALCK